jgi:hypothetical protein
LISINVGNNLRRKNLSILVGVINNNEEFVMLSRLRRCRFLTALLAVSILFVSVQPAVNAAIVSTSDLVATEQSKISREYLLNSLEREEVRTALTSQGVDLEMAKQRVSSMTDEEIRALNQKMDEMPAGGGVVGVVVIVFLVLIITDLVGWTDVFPFVNKQ